MSSHSLPVLSSPSPRRVAWGRLWPWAAAALLSVLACGEGPADTDGAGTRAGVGHEPRALREVRHVLPITGAEAIAPLLAERWSGEDTTLGAGERRVFVLRTSPDSRYFVRVRHDGPAPQVVRVEREGSLAPVARLPGRRAPGLFEALLIAEGKGVRLALVGPPGGTRVKELLVRRFATSPGSTAANDERVVPDASAGPPTSAAPAAPRVEPATVYQDHRPAIALAVGAPLRLPATLPENATRLAFALAPDPDLGLSGGALAGRRLGVFFEFAEGGRTQLGYLALEGRRHLWQDVTLSLERVAGRKGGLAFELAVPGATDGTPDARFALSVPQVFCERGARRPNVVLISLDTTRPDHLGVYGAARDTSPRLDAWARDAVIFDRAKSTAPYTLPAHASLLSGQFPSTHGAEHPAHALDIARTPMLASQLAEQGYLTRAFTGGGYLNADFGFAHGFAAYSNNDPIFDPDHFARSRFAGSYAGKLMIEARSTQNWDAALAWLEAHRELPFFLFLQTFAIHDYRPAGEHKDLWWRPGPDGTMVTRLRSLEKQLGQSYTANEREQLVDLYDGAIHQVDEHLGALFDTLERLGLAENTIVVVTADHGETFGEHQAVDGRGRSAPLVGHSWSMHEELLAVPFLLRAPGVVPRRVFEPVSMVNLAPTLLDLLDQPVPETMQGRSLAPFLRSEEGLRGAPVLAEAHNHATWQEALWAGPLKLVRGDVEVPGEFPAQVALRLHDLSAEGEARDLVDSRAEEAAELAGVLEALVSGLRAARGGEAVEAELSEATRRQLEELGYLGG